MKIIRLLGCLLCSTAFVTNATASETTFVYIGTQSADPGMGVMRARFDSATGTLSPPELVATTKDPAFLVIHPDGRHLYVCNTGTPGGLSAFAIAPQTGALTLLNSKSSPEPRGPSHVSVDRTGRYVFDANYGGGHVRIHALAADGSLGEETAFVQHEGHSVHPQRQTKPYAHWFGTDPDNRFALAADLGLDQILVYRFDVTTGRVAPNDPFFVKVTPGSGPRHLAFHPNGKFVYAIEELANAVTVFSWDGARGALAELQTISTLPAKITAPSSAAEIAVHRNGRFLYTSNRGHNTIAVFAIEATTGRLALRQHIRTHGTTPRFFAFDPTNRWLLVGNQDSDNALIFRIDDQTGELAPHGEPISIAKPFGIAFLATPSG